MDINIKNYKPPEWVFPTVQVHWEALDVTIKEMSKTVTPANTQPKFSKSIIVSDELPKGSNLWGLNNPNWNLPKMAADYYLLNLGVVVNEEKFQPYLDRCSKILAEQFSRYTDMALGGELRHTRNSYGIPKPLKDALSDKTIIRSSSGGSRAEAWEGWFWFRSRWGLLALRWARDMFNDNGKWSNGYGGEKWGTIANTLYLYESDEISAQTFIDTCWGLQHNGGLYFNKWWKTFGVQTVLDNNQVGWYCRLYDDASHVAQNLWSTQYTNDEIGIQQSQIRELCECSNCKNINGDTQ
jgi:hypothetical protein